MMTADLRKKLLPALLGAMVLGLVGIQLAGCAAQLKQVDKPGIQLWGENCGRCHNVRPATSMDDEHWEVVVQHMRTRANLTGDEAEKILTFLKASN